MKPHSLKIKYRNQVKRSSRLSEIMGKNKLDLLLLFLAREGLREDKEREECEATCFDLF